MISWFEKNRKATDTIIQKINNLPFIVELMEGTLPKDIFHFYVNQDSLYLAEYKKSLATLAIKCRDTEDTQFFLNAATGIIRVEDALHKTFLKGVNINPEPSPTCELYNSYLARMVNNQSLEEGLGAILPCFTIYMEVGEYILKNQSNKGSNPYQNWINTYGGEDFKKSVEQAIAITNKHAENASTKVLERMESTFAKATKLEWMFWNSAYNKEAWEI